MNRLTSHPVRQERFAAGKHFRGKITPVGTDVARPLWSVMIPVYNAGESLRRTLTSVLDQAPGAEMMQIAVVDDCSTANDPRTLIDKLAGPRIEFHRHARNIGHSRNFNSCIDRARGRLVHILHADDWVGNGFYDAMARLFDQFAQIGAGFCRHAIMDEEGAMQRLSPLEREDPGVIEEWLVRIAADLPVQPPSMVVRRSVYQELGGFDTRMASCGEDWEMWVRIAAHYPVGFHPQVLAYYQDSSNSLTKRSVRSGQNIKDVRKATHIIASYLGRGPARAANRKAGANWARWAFYWAEKLIESGDYRGAAVQLREALLCSRSPATLKEAAKISRNAAHNLLRRHWKGAP